MHADCHRCKIRCHISACLKTSHTCNNRFSDLVGIIWGLRQKSRKLFFFFLGDTSPDGKFDAYRQERQGVNNKCGQWIALKYRNTLIYYYIYRAIYKLHGAREWQHSTHKVYQTNLGWKTLKLVPGYCHHTLSTIWEALNSTTSAFAIPCEN